MILFNRLRIVKQGLSVIEVIVSLSVLSIVILAISSIFAFNLSMITIAKARSVGLGLATEKMENLKNLPYDSLATQSGPIYPPGNIADSENVTVSGLNLRVDTVINYVDSPYDGNYSGTIPNKPADLYPYDYKKATIKVYLVSGNRLVSTLSTDIAGKVAETASNTGIVLIKVQNANGDPVQDATVHLTNSNPDPDVDITTTTDNQGQVLIPKMPPDTNEGYHVVVSKSGYSTDQTYPEDVTTPAPTQPDFNVITQQTTIQTFAIDQLANMTVHLVDESENPVASVPLAINSQKTINLVPVMYKYNQTINSNGSGIVPLTGIEWDSYDFSITGWTILSSSPNKPVSILPLASQDVTLMITNSPSGKAVITTVNPASGQTSTSVAVDISGNNLTGTTGVRLRRSGQADIVASSVNTPSDDLLNATLDLNGAATGSWDIIVTKPAGSTIQYGGFNVTN